MQPCRSPVSRSPIEFGAVVAARWKDVALDAAAACCFVVSIPSIKADYVGSVMLHYRSVAVFPVPEYKQPGLFFAWIEDTME
jgi:hypothetical protein